MVEFVANFGYFKGKPVFDNAAFKIGEGEKICVSAPLGAGKTTLFEIISGLQKNWQGTINGIYHADFARDFSVSFLPEKPVLFENKSVIENLKYAGKILKLDSGFGYISVLKEFGLNGLEKVKAKKLGLVKRQALALARAFLKRPSILLVDDWLRGVTSESDRDGLTSLVRRAICFDGAVIVGMSSNEADFDFSPYDRVLTIVDQKIVDYV